LLPRFGEECFDLQGFWVQTSWLVGAAIDDSVETAESGVAVFIRVEYVIVGLGDWYCKNGRDEDAD